MSDSDMIKRLASARLDKAIDERLGIIVDRIAAELLDEAMTEELYASLEQRVRDAFTKDDKTEEEQQEEPPAAETTLVYATSVDWFEQYWCFLYRRETSTRAPLWCQQWWEHPEAATRIELLWRSWEAARQSDPMTGLAAWFVNIADPMMAQLLSPEGTFKGCIDGEHVARDGEDVALPYTPAPEMMRAPTGNAERAAS